MGGTIRTCKKTSTKRIANTVLVNYLGPLKTEVRMFLVLSITTRIICCTNNLAVSRVLPRPRFWWHKQQRNMTIKIQRTQAIEKFVYVAAVTLYYVL